MEKLKNVERLLLNNKAWVAQKVMEDKHFFDHTSEVQKPDFLWIGCSDSRVPANEITGTEPGEIFVTRNIANTVIHTDMSMLSVLDYAVNVLEVNHVILCGHYGCGGLRAAMGNKQHGLIDNWIRHIKDVYVLFQKEIEAFETPQEREDAFAEFNVIENLFDLSQTSIIQNAWLKRGSPWLHGWIYDLKSGLIKDLNVSMNSTKEMPALFKFKQ